MKAKIEYMMKVSKEIELTPKQFYNLLADNTCMPDIIPNEAINPTITYDQKGLNELLDTFD